MQARPATVSVAGPTLAGMDDGPPPEERKLVRSAADEIVAREVRDRGHREYRQMARGTIAALDWLEGRRETAPSTGEYRFPGDVVERSKHWQPTALAMEIVLTEDWGSGHVRPPNEDMHFHGAVWSVLKWWRSPSQPPLLSINVPGLDA